MKFSAQQECALSAVAGWLASGTSPFFYLAGYAGTGKTTLAKYFADTVAGEVFFGSFTGKAAHVMRSKGCRDATTIHRLIYQPNSKSTERLRKLQDQLKELLAGSSVTYPERIGELRRAIVREVKNVKSPGFTLNMDSAVRGASLVIIDECSMVNPQMGEDLLSFGCPVLVLGDPAQLPPVRGTGYFTASDPDYMLEEIHRQALDSGVLRMATDVRQGRVPGIGADYGADARVISRLDIVPAEMPNYDQILVGRNGTRRKTNARMRSLLGFTGDLPLLKDKLVCLRNNHDMGLLNGGLWDVLDSTELDEDRIGLTIENDEGQIVNIEAWNCIFRGEDLAHYSHDNEVQEFDFGYVLTVHKSQGSEWPKVVVIDESHKFPINQNPLQWAYTACTRAQKQLLWAK